MTLICFMCFPNAYGDPMEHVAMFSVRICQDIITSKPHTECTKSWYKTNAGYFDILTRKMLATRSTVK